MRAWILYFAVAMFAVVARAEFEEVPACPPKTIVSCLAGERLDIERDDAGCEIVSCVASASMRVEETFLEVCPKFEPIPCGTDRQPATILDVSGCRIPTCSKQ